MTEYYKEQAETKKHREEAIEALKEMRDMMMESEICVLIAVVGWLNHRKGANK